jgi:hypothetical protein
VQYMAGGRACGGHRHRELNELLKNRSLRPFFVYAHNKPLSDCVTSLTDYTHTHILYYATHIERQIDRPYMIHAYIYIYIHVCMYVCICVL